MADYKTMYTKLFNATTDAIGILQKAQQDTEETFIMSPESVLSLVAPIITVDDGDDTQKDG